MNKEGTDIDISSLTYSVESLFATRRVLSWGESKPSRELASILKDTDVTDCRYDSARCNNSNSWYRCEATADGMCNAQSLHLTFKLNNSLIQRSVFFEQIIECFFCELRKSFAVDKKNFWQELSENSSPLRYGDSVLMQQLSHLVHKSCTCGH